MLGKEQKVKGELSVQQVRPHCRELPPCLLSSLRPRGKLRESTLMVNHILGLGYTDIQDECHSFNSLIGERAMKNQFFLPVIQWGLAGTKRGVPQRSQYSMRKEYRKCHMKTKGHDPHSSPHLKYYHPTVPSTTTPRFQLHPDFSYKLSCEIASSVESSLTFIGGVQTCHLLISILCHREQKSFTFLLLYNRGLNGQL